MKTLIMYRSKHHGNTKKLVDAIVEAYPEVETLDVSTLGKHDYPDLHEYRMIGVASGIYYGEIDKDLARVMSNTLLPEDRVFGLLTYGGKNKWYGKDIDGICRMRMANFLGAFGCCGYDTWGPYRFTGGMNQGRPNQEDLEGAVNFYKHFVDDYEDIFEDQYQQREKRWEWERLHPAGGLLSNVKRTAKKLAQKAKGEAPKKQKKDAE
ncbi:MAG: hypothetical protein Q4B30_02180 [Coriobacteriaceae bacterium]|nr:hypothetical protein [Coriobacteriaceae bacterium]